MATEPTFEPRKIHKLGWIPDLPDIRYDMDTGLPQVTLAELPEKVGFADELSCRETIKGSSGAAPATRSPPPSSSTG